MNKLLFMFLHLISSLSFAYDTISIDAILGSVYTDHELTTQEQKLSFLNEPSFGIPAIDKIEFRIDNKAAFSADIPLNKRLRYSVRFSPTGIGETVATQKLIRTDREHHTIKKEILLNSLLKDKYFFTIDYFHKKKILRGAHELKTLLEDRITVLEKIASISDFDFNNMIKVENDYTDLHLDIISKESQIKAMEEKLRLYFPGKDSICIDTSDLIDVATLKEILEKTVIKIDSNNIFLEECNLKLKSAENKYRLECVTNRKYVSFFEVEFDAEKYSDEIDRMDKGKKNDINKAFGLGVGITLPIVNTNKLDVNKRMLTLIDERSDYSDKKVKLEQSVTEMQMEIQLLIEKYNFLNQRRSEIRIESFLEKYASLDGEDPLILLRVQESLIKNEDQMDKLKFDIYLTYIKILSITGHLSQSPVRNYLSVERAVIK